MPACSWPARRRLPGRCFRGAVLSAITVVEVATKLARLGMPPADARAVFEFHLPCPVIPFDAGQAFIAKRACTPSVSVRN